MNNKTTEIQMTPIELLTYCQNRLGNIPITVSQADAIGQPIKEVVNLLEQLKKAMLAPSEIQEERTV